MAAKKAKKEPRSTFDIASELLEVRQLKNRYVEIDAKLTAELKTRIKDGDNDQDYFEIRTYPDIKIVNASKAVEWAQKNYPHLLTVDGKAARAILKRALTPLPAGFETKQVERLTQIGSNDEE